MLSQVEKTRLIVSRGTAAAKKSQFGQFFTPERTATFMAGLFPDANGCCRLLDAGAGIGSLSAAFLERWRAGGFCFNRVELDAFEIDRQLHPHLSQTLQQYNAGDSLVVRISGDDYIHAAATQDQRRRLYPRGRYASVRRSLLRTACRLLARHPQSAVQED